jgi:putative (di)nucleoside polyphosphate hydrolase
MIINDRFEVFVGKRTDIKTESWQMPQGGIDDGETAEEAVMREMKEEIGNDYGKIIASTDNWYTYDLPRYLIAKLWDSKYRGQKQKWFLIKYLGEDKDIDILSDEFSEFVEWKWMKMEDLVHIIVSFKKDIYLSVIEEFRDEIIKLKTKNDHS